jgi:serine phosphatase RsbU (regulator of sigma subunit)
MHRSVLNKLFSLLFIVNCFLPLTALAQNKDTKNLQQLLQQAQKLAKTNYDSSLTITKQVIILSKQQNKLYELALAYKLVGYCHYFKSNYPLALEYYQKAEKIAEQNQYKDVLLSLHNYLGTFYKKQNHLKEALSEFKKGELVSEELKDSVNIASFKNDIGLVYELENKLPEAITHFKESLALYKHLANKTGMSYSLDYLGEAYALQGKFDEALKICKQALEIRKTLQEYSSISINLNNIGEIYILQKKFNDALPYLFESEKISREIKYGDLQTHTLSLIGQCYYNLKDYKNAYDYYKQSTEIKDSIYNEKNARSITEMEAKYQNEKKQLQIESLNQQNELKATKLSKQKTTIILVLLVAVLAFIGVFFIMISNRKIKKAHRIIAKQKELVEQQKTIVEQQKHEVETQKELVDEKNKEMLDSIHYAKRIQHAVITSDNYISKHVKEHFILYKPKDIVSGDFYWAHSFDEKFYLAIADCTGHGVPGAFMSLLNISILNEIVIEKKITLPNLILDEARKEIIHALNPEGQEQEVKDGMDCILCCFDMRNNILQYAAANNSFYIVRENNLITCPADKMPVGKSPRDHELFTLQTVELKKGDIVYTLTDGLPDQFGGPKGKKYKYKQLEELLLMNNDKSLEEQKNILTQSFDTWKGNLEQVDDVTLIGIKI